MKLHVFVCASPLFPQDPEQDELLHGKYLRIHLEHLPSEDAVLTIVQNGCRFPTPRVGIVRNPIVKSVAYNWLLCDANCGTDYWLFLPEDCRVLPRGWKEIWRHIEKGKDCFALSRDPKAFVCRQGIFRQIPKEVRSLCDMNFLGKEIACVILREELERRDFHCISRDWTKVSTCPDRWGNEFYEEMNDPDHPDINKALRLPIFQSYGFDGWKASKEELEATFMKIISSSLEEQRQDAEKMKDLISHYGPLISEGRFKGALGHLLDRLAGR